MKSGALSIILSALALGGVGVVYLKVEDLSDRLSSVRTRTRASGGGGRVASERDESAYGIEPAKAAPGTNGGPMTAADGKRSEGTARERALEARLDKLEKDLKERSKSKWNAPLRLSGKQWARSPKHLASLLKLNKTQEAQVENAIENGKRRIEEILKIPDESGTSPYERRKELNKRIQEAAKTGKWGEITKVAMEHSNFREQKIPGRNTTYGDEIKRVQKETRDEISNSLTAEQQKTFQNTNTDHMLGGGGTTIAYSTSLGGDGPTGIMVERGIDIAVEDDGSKKSEATAEKPEAEKDNE